MPCGDTTCRSPSSTRPPALSGTAAKTPRCEQAFRLPDGKRNTLRVVEMRRKTRPAVWLLRDAQAQHQLEVLEPRMQLGELAFQAQPVANLQLIGRSA